MEQPTELQTKDHEYHIQYHTTPSICTLSHHSADDRHKTSVSWWQLNQALQDQEAKPFKKPDVDYFYDKKARKEPSRIHFIVQIRDC